MNKYNFELQDPFNENSKKAIYSKTQANMAVKLR